MPMLPETTVIGSWRTVRTEPLAGVSPQEGRFLHFTADGELYWEHPFITEAFLKLIRLGYRMSENGVFIKPNSAGKGWKMPFEMETDCLVVSSPNSRRWWLRRILPEERPDYLTFYVAPLKAVTAL